MKQKYNKKQTNKHYINKKRKVKYLTNLYNGVT